MDPSVTKPLLEPSDGCDDGSPHARAAQAETCAACNSIAHLEPEAVAVVGTDADNERRWPVKHLVRVEDSNSNLDDGYRGDDAWHRWSLELKRLLSLASPIAAQNLLAFSLSLISVAFVGHLGSRELSIAILATSLYNLTGNSVMQGLAGGMETLCGQAYGAGSYQQVGIVLQRALAILGLTCCSMAVLWTRAGWLLQTMGQTPELAEGAGRYLLLVTPALFFTAICECLKRYLMAQAVVQPALLVTAAVTLLSPLYNWGLIHSAGLGLDGAALALDAQLGSMAVLLAGYVVLRERSRKGQPCGTWGGWTSQAFTGWRQYLGLAIPSGGMVCLEWWIFEAVIIMAGWLPHPETAVSVMGICMNIISCIYMLPLGLAAATSTRVSNALGAGRPLEARTSARCALGICVAITLVTCSAVIALRDVLAMLFTNDRKVIRHTARVLPILAAALLGDALLATLAGILRGCGRQVVGALMNAVAYWGIGFPLAYCLAFKAGWGTAGLWTGLAVVTNLQSCVIGGYLATLTWQQEAARAVVRVTAMDAPEMQAPAPVIGSAGTPFARIRTATDAARACILGAVSRCLMRMGVWLQEAGANMAPARPHDPTSDMVTTDGQDRGATSSQGSNTSLAGQEDIHAPRMANGEEHGDVNAV